MTPSNTSDHTSDQDYISSLFDHSVLNAAASWPANSPAKAACGSARISNPGPGPRRRWPRSGFRESTAVITREGESVLATLGDPALWDAFAQIGIKALHTGPMKQSGGVTGRTLTPTIDGNFDRIGLEIDPTFGTVEEFQAMSRTATAHGAVMIDDIIPGTPARGRTSAWPSGAWATIPASITWWRSSRKIGPCCPMSKRARTRSTSPWTLWTLCKPPAISSASFPHHLLRTGHQGHGLERHGPGYGHGRCHPALGLSPLFQGGPTHPQLAGPLLRRPPLCDRRRPAFPGASWARPCCAWTPTASWASNSARTAGPGPKATRSR